MARVHLKEGNVFRLSIDDDHTAFGQVIARYGKDAYYFGIFGLIFLTGSDPDISEITKGSLAILGLSLDAKIAAGDWQVVGNAPVQDGFPLPAYKEAFGSPNDIIVVDYSGTRRRTATAAEAATLPNRKIVAPVRLERAIRAFHNREPWLANYDELRPCEEFDYKNLFD